MANIQYSLAEVQGLHVCASWCNYSIMFLSCFHILDWGLFNKTLHVLVLQDQFVMVLLPTLGCGRQRFSRPEKQHPSCKLEDFGKTEIKIESKRWIKVGVRRPKQDDRINKNVKTKNFQQFNQTIRPKMTIRLNYLITIVYS